MEHHTEPEAILEVIANLIERLSAREQTRLRRSFSVWVNLVLHALIDQQQPEPNDLVVIKTMLGQRIMQRLNSTCSQYCFFILYSGAGLRDIAFIKKFPVPLTSNVNYSTVVSLFPQLSKTNFHTIKNHAGGPRINLSCIMHLSITRHEY